MSSLFLSTSQVKFTPPSLPRILIRPRLIKRLKQGLEQRHVLILGQAAQGKTTLAASHLAQSSISSAWINLEPSDSDPVNFFHSLTRGLDFAFHAKSPFASFTVSPDFSQTPRSLIRLYRVWVRTLFAPIRNPLHVVLDGLDRLSDKAPAFDISKLLLQEAPENVRFILLSRHRPPINLENMKINRQVLILENEELSFTTKEVGDFFASVRGINLPGERIAQIQKLVEGWTGGLILLSEYLDRLTPEERDDYFEGLDLEKFKREVFLFFANNIFEDLAPEIKDFMVYASMFEVLEPRLMKVLQPSVKAEETLNWLAMKNLFVTVIPSERDGVAYRFHKLFLEFLRSKLDSVLDLQQRCSLFLKVANILQESEELEHALNLYLKARERQRAADVIHQLGFDLLKLGRTGDLAKWIGELPPEMVKDDPLIELFMCMTRRWTGMKKNLEALPRINAQFQRLKNLRGQLTCLALWLETSFRTGAAWSMILDLIDQSVGTLESGDQQEYQYEKGRLWAQIGLCHSIRGNPRLAISACRSSYMAANNLRDSTLACETLPHYINALIHLGEFEQAQMLMKKFEKRADQSYEPAHHAYVNITKTLLLIFKGEAIAARSYLDQAQELVEEQGLLYLQVVTLLYDLMWSVDTENHDRAKQIGGQLVQVTSSMGINFLQGLVFELLGLSAYKKGDFSQAAKWLGNAMDILATDEGRAETHYYGSALMAALVHSNLEDEILYDDQIQDALSFFRDISSPCHLAEGHLCAALVKWRQGQQQEAVAHLKRSLEQIGEMQALHFLWISSSDLAQACSLALEMDIPSATEIICSISNSNPLIHFEPELLRLEQRNEPIIKERAREVRLRLRRQSAPPLRIKTLGTFQVLRGEFPLSQKEWRGKKSKLLLKALVAHGIWAVPKDLVIEALWAEADPITAEKSFKVALHRLRKVLEPDLDNSLGSLYLHLDYNILSLDSELCWVDLDNFKSLIEQGLTREQEGRQSEALEKYQQAAQLYEGDFLLEDLYESWAQPLRDQMRESYINTLVTVASLHEADGSLRKASNWYARALETDPCLEEVCRSLMLIYKKMGKTDKAIKAFLHCQKAMQQYLDTEPDEITVSLYRSMKQ